SVGADCSEGGAELKDDKVTREPDALWEGVSSKGFMRRVKEAYPKASRRRPIFPRHGASRRAAWPFAPLKTRFLPPASLERGNPCAVRSLPPQEIPHAPLRHRPSLRLAPPRRPPPAVHPRSTAGGLARSTSPRRAPPSARQGPQ